MAWASGAGEIVHPMRQPVIAYALATPFTTTSRSRDVAASRADAAGAPSLRRSDLMCTSMVRSSTKAPSSIAESMSWVRVNARPGWQEIVRAYGFTHALVPGDSALKAALEQAGWAIIYKDEVAVLLEAR